MNLDDVDALSFDCYGTLIDWESGILAVLRPWADRSGVTADDEELLADFGRHESSVEGGQPGLAYPEVLAEVMRRIGADHGVPVTPDEADALGASVKDWPAFPDSPQALRSLKERYRLIILSNVDRESFAASNARLGVTFDAVVTAQDVGSYKPDARNFDALLAAAAELGVGPDRLVHVAQSLFHDHVPAQAAGLPTVWINRRSGRTGSGATPVPATAVVPDREYPTLAAFAAAVEAEASPKG